MGSVSVELDETLKPDSPMNTVPAATGLPFASNTWIRIMGAGQLLGSVIEPLIFAFPSSLKVAIAVVPATTPLHTRLAPTPVTPALPGVTPGTTRSVILQSTSPALETVHWPVPFHGAPPVATPAIVASVVCEPTIGTLIKVWDIALGQTYSRLPTTSQPKTLNFILFSLQDSYVFRGGDLPNPGACSSDCRETGKPDR